MATFVDASTTPLSNNDFDVLYKAFQDKHFCKHFADFANEISDPKNIDHYERELKKLEKERGVDVSLLQSLPGIAFQAELCDNGSIVFVNISVSSKIEKPNFSCVSDKFKWTVPHAIVKPRLEYSLGKLLTKGETSDINLILNIESLQNIAKKDGILIYEIIVNPLCIDLSKQNRTLKNHLIQIAGENIKKELNVDLKNEKILGFDIYVGNPSATQVKSVEDATLYEEKKNDNVHMKLAKESNLTKPRNGNVSASTANSCQLIENSDKFYNERVKIPTYKLKHVNHITLQDYSVVKSDFPECLRPQILLLEIKLPGVKSASNIDVHVSEKDFHLITQKDVKYCLDLTLPYEVENEPKGAKFTTSTSVLEVELKVIKNVKSAVVISSDSGIECENGYRTNSDEDNSSVSSHESDLKAEGNNQNQIVDNNYMKSPMPNWQCTQSNKFLFLSMFCENIIIKSIKVIVLSLNSFKYLYKTKCEAEKSPSLYEGIIFVTPNSFKEKGITYHVLDENLTIQVEKNVKEMWNKVEVRTREINANISDCDCEDSQNEKPKNTYSLTIDLLSSELEMERKRTIEKVSLSIESKKYCRDMISASSKEDIEAFFKKPLLPKCTFTQSFTFLMINIPCKNMYIEDIFIELIDQKNFRFIYKCFGHGFTSLVYGGYVNTSPYAFKNNGVSYHKIEDTLLIQVEKKYPNIWCRVRMDLQQRKMKEFKVKILKNAQEQQVQKEFDLENEVSIDKENEDEEDCENESESDENNQTWDVASPESSEVIDAKEKSSEIDIPQQARNTTDCFVTGSWPRGILKSRSRSLSDSQVDSHVDSPQDDGNGEDVDDDVLAEVTEDDVEMSEENDVVGGSSPKKSVRFNEFVCKQVFKVNSSICGQKAKNLKKAQQRKRSRERKLSEGSQSSEGETVTEQSDLATTTEDESNTDAENSGKECKKEKRSSKVKKKEKTNNNNKKTKKKKKPVLSLSNEMVFQLDDD